jgi:predicted porin
MTVAYYHQHQNSFQSTSAPAGVIALVNPGTAVVNPGGTCTNASSTTCSGQMDAVSFVVDYRFAKHFDAYAGIGWSQSRNGLASGFLLANGNSNGTLNAAGSNKASVFDPGVGLRYQF